MSSTLDPKEWYELNRFTLQLTGYRAPVLSLYLPSYAIAEGSTILEEGGRSEELERIKQAIAHVLDKAKHDSGSVCVFGWSENEHSTVKHARISKEVPPLYVILRKPYLKPLRDILEIGLQIVVIIMDHKKAKIEVYNGSQLVQEIGIKSYLKGRHKKGGQSAKRFNQNRILQVRYFFNKVSQQLSHLKASDLEMVLLAGRGEAKKKFLSIMEEELSRKVHVVNTITFETSNKEIKKRIISILDRVRKDHELKLLAGLEDPAKHGLVISKNEDIEKKAREGAVRTLFVASDYHATSREVNSLIRRIIRSAKINGSNIEFITDPTARRRLHRFGNVVAHLRYTA